MAYKKGEIVWADLGQIDTDEIWGHEQGGNRPVLILTAEKNEMVTIIPFSTAKKRMLDGNTVAVSANTTNGLDKDSVLLCDQIRRISTKRIYDEPIIGILDNLYLNAAIFSIKLNLDIP
jgi:mRNA-degrading endonuclease toxin of MazEF toxin-antitoxin module